MRTERARRQRRAKTESEIAGFHETRDRETSLVTTMLLGAFGTLGLPVIWVKVLEVAGPVLVRAGAGLVKGLHPESPGGGKLTKGELRRIAENAGEELKRRLLDAFLPDAVEDILTPKRGAVAVNIEHRGALVETITAPTDVPATDDPTDGGETA